MLIPLIGHLLFTLLFIAVTHCTRPEGQNNAPQHHAIGRQSNVAQAQNNPTAPGASSNPGGQQSNPLRITTNRMKPVTGPGSPRVMKAYHDVRRSAGGKVLKGVAHTGILANPTSDFDYPKLSVTPGNKEGGIVSFFHHPAHTPNDKPYQYMQREKLDTHQDIKERARSYPLGTRKHVEGSEDDQVTRARLKVMTDNQRHPRAALTQITSANPAASHKRPRVDVDGGKHHGHLLTFVYGPESPEKHGQTSSSSQPVQAHPFTRLFEHDYGQKYPSNQGSIRSQSPVRGEDNKRRRIE